MADMESRPKIGSKRGRSARDKMQNRMTKRMKRLFSVKGSLNKIINRAAEKKEAETMDAARMILQDVEFNDHILSSKAFAYRRDLSSEEPYRGRENFLSALQKVLFTKGYLEVLGTFLKRDVSPSSPPIVAAHLDITSEVKLSPSLRMQRTTVGEAVYDKVEKFVKPFVKSSVHRLVEEFHIHVDVTHLLPLQHSSAKAEEELHQVTRENISSDDECGEEREVYTGICHTWTPMKVTWCSLISNPQNFNFLKYLHAASAAKATVSMRLTEPHEARSSDQPAAMEGRSGCTAFLHGTPIAITKEARRCSL